jgi:hypothetical protein
MITIIISHAEETPSFFINAVNEIDNYAYYLWFCKGIGVKLLMLWKLKF